MPCYHFFQNEDEGGADDLKIQVATTDPAQKIGLRAAADILRDMAFGQEDLGRRWTLRVTDEAGLTLYRLKFELEVCSPAPAPCGNSL